MVWKVFSLIGNVGIRALVGCCRPERIAAPSGLAHKLVAVVKPASRVVDELNEAIVSNLVISNIILNIFNQNIVPDTTVV